MIEIEFFSYFFVLLSIYGLWLFKKRVVYGFAALALVISLIADVVDISGFTMIASYTFLVMAYYKHTLFKPVKFLLFITIFFFSILLMKSLIPGVYNWQIIDNEFLSTGAVQYSLYLNIDKAAIAIVLGLFVLKPIRHISQVVHIFRDIFPLMIFGVTLLIALGLVSTTVDFDFKMPDLWLIWMIVNLGILCVSQELFLRLFLQDTITTYLPNNIAGKGVAILICAMIFAFLFPPHPNVYFMTFIAALFYGYAYERSKRVEASILLHFIINCIHFFFFTYPYIDVKYF